MTTEDTEIQTSLEPSLLQVHTGPDSAIHQPIYMDFHPSPSCYYRAGVQGRNAVVRCDRKKSEDERRGAIVPFWHELRGLVWLFFFFDSTMMVEAGPPGVVRRGKLWLLCPKGVFIRVVP